MFMDLAEMKVSNTNVVNVTDSLKAPLLKLSIKNNSSTTIPTGNDLIIYVDKSSEETSERKTYLFTLTNPLQFASETSDEFIIEPVLDGNKVTMKTYVKRLISEGAVLTEATIEEVDTQSIVLFEGANYISTNYTNADLSIVYPKNNDLALFFLNNAIYGHNNENKVLSLDDIYFKDCFTEVEAGINAVFNKVTMKCMDSTNGNFSLDCDGNLVVNTVTERNPQTSGGSAIDFDSIYPVGSIYLSVASTNPGTLFGGTWERIQDKFLLASGSTYSAGTQGGAASHTHTGPSHCHTGPSHTHSGPSHTHSVSAHTHSLSDNGRACIHHNNGYFWFRELANINGTKWVDTSKAEIVGASSSTNNSYSVALTGATDSAGSGNTGASGTGTTGASGTGNTSYSGTGSTGSASTLPPYLAIYVWKRTA